MAGRWREDGGEVVGRWWGGGGHVHEYVHVHVVKVWCGDVPPCPCPCPKGSRGMYAPAGLGEG